ncbi:unnamed protein product [Linum tenue]|uniref:60S ribosomal protein L2, mitochondrial n=1 Tax=Linum tenue TaxID=586396 RepID=A0AAV0N3E8_9ROSI|nr:unnamed protein product [Linum tenue]
MAAALKQRLGTALAGQAWQSLNGNVGLRSFATKTGGASKAGTRASAPAVKKIKEGHRALTLNVGKTAGRNSAGRITSYHRGGGAKRLHRRIDTKRETASIGVVERIEYDPNRSSRIALVRWVEGGQHSPLKFKENNKQFPRQHETIEPVTTTTQAKYTLASMARNVDQRTVAYYSPVMPTSLVVGGLPMGKPVTQETLIQRTSVRDIFLTAFSRNCQGKSAPATPRVAIVGAQPKFYAPQLRGEGEGKTVYSLAEVRKYNKQSSVWDNRNKRKAAVSWQSCAL